MNASVLPTGNRGFTLVELIVVMCILAVLATIAIPAYGKIQDVARTARAVVELRDIEKDISAATIERGGSLPADLAAAGHPNARDPWGNPYVYSDFISVGADAPRMGPFGAGDQLNSDFDLYSKGSDGFTRASDLSGTAADDILRGGEGTYMGLAKHYTEI